MAIDVRCYIYLPYPKFECMNEYRSASKDAELEATYLRLLKESSPHEKAISRDLGRRVMHRDVR